ncbi:MAG: tRNA 2-thiouridine(34) synthase MnmA [Thermoleophilaceae bacterium]
MGAFTSLDILSTVTAHSRYAEHLVHPRGRGALTGSSHRGAAGGSACGDLVTLSVEIEDGLVAAAGFDARGCGAVVAAGSAVVELVEGAAVLDAARVSPDDVDRALGGLSPARRHAAHLAADALHRALGAAAAGGAAVLPPNPRRTLVAMSGGVDSALAAQLALEAGHEVVGVTLELWADAENDGGRSCCSPQAVTGARALAHGMGLPHLTLDLRAAFRREVVEDYLVEHAAGRTPNPCVRCNGRVRFAEMLRLAGDLGAARLATGHYARIGRDAEGPLLEPAADAGKDQAYVLARIGPHDLDRLWFPLGELEKSEVRERARRARIPVADRPDSQDLCFLAGTGREQFLRRHGTSPLPTASPPGGEIVALDGRVLGHHDGQERFTVGQRRGLGLAAPEPLFVVRKDAASGRVTVGPRAALAAGGAVLDAAVLHRPAARVDRVKLRYRSAPVPCRVVEDAGPGEHGRLELTFAAPAEAVAPGQTAVLMQGERVLGAAVVAAATTTVLAEAASAA